MNVLLAVHGLPLWFLVIALFLPRIAFVMLWLKNALGPFHLDSIVAPIVWLFVPRALVLYVIYLDQGIGIWFIIHLLAAVMVWAGSGRYHVRRRRRRYVDQ